jgi:hypothetical protein
MKEMLIKISEVSSFIIVVKSIAQKIELIVGNLFQQSQTGLSEDIYLKAAAKLEGLLYGYHNTLHAEKHIPESEYVWQIVQLLLNQQLQPLMRYVRMTRTTLRVIIESAKYLENNQSKAQATFQFLATQFQDAETNDLASEAFQVMCSKNFQFVRSNLESFFQLYQQMHSNSKIVEGLAKAIVSDSHTMQQYLVTLCQPFVLIVQQYYQQHLLLK